MLLKDLHVWTLQNKALIKKNRQMWLKHEPQQKQIVGTLQTIEPRCCPTYIKNQKKREKLSTCEHDKKVEEWAWKKKIKYILGNDFGG